MPWIGQTPYNTLGEICLEDRERLPDKEIEREAKRELPSSQRYVNTKEQERERKRAREQESKSEREREREVTLTTVRSAAQR